MIRRLFSFRGYHLRCVASARARTKVKQAMESPTAIVDAFGIAVSA